MKTCIICSKELHGNQTMYCSDACKQKAHWQKLKTQQNSYHSQTLRGIKRKYKFIKMLGGQCSSCGYNKNLSALEFNHINSNEKSFGLDIRKLSNTNEDDLLLELKKCNLLCANCHREHHYVELDMKNVEAIINQ
jgi:5-methylcytosine-specific restriction endonuclease McrA